MGLLFLKCHHCDLFIVISFFLSKMQHKELYTPAVFQALQVQGWGI